MDTKNSSRLRDTWSNNYFGQLECLSKSAGLQGSLRFINDCGEYFNLVASTKILVRHANVKMAHVSVNNEIKLIHHNSAMLPTQFLITQRSYCYQLILKLQTYLNATAKISIFTASVVISVFVSLDEYGTLNDIFFALGPIVYWFIGSQMKR